MRIVGGSLGGRRFRGPPGPGTRPTSERVREALASALDARGLIDDARVLDLWAGTGALAFELLSRGARAAVLVEGDRRTARAIEDSARSLGLTERARCVQADLDSSPRRWLESLGRGPFDLVVADPPYARVARVADVLTALLDRGLLDERAVVVIEHARGAAPSLPRGFREERSYRYGDSAVLLAAREAGHENPAEREGPE